MRSPQEIRARLQGPCNSLPVIFTKDGEIDYRGMCAVIDRSIDGGCDIIMLTWGDSLVSLLTDDEVAAVHRTVVQHVAGRAITIACDNMWWLGKTREFGQFVMDLGFDLFMARPPEWAPSTPEDLAAWYRGVAEVARVMLVGNVPLRTCELIENESNILGFKEDAGTEYAHEVLMRWGEQWPMIGGGGFKRHYLLWPHGNCRAWLDIFIRCYPSPTQRYWEALQRGDHRAAWDIAMTYETPIRTFGRQCRYGMDGLIKHAMLEVYGVAPRWRRSPAPNATDEELDVLRDYLRRHNMLD